MTRGLLLIVIVVLGVGAGVAAALGVSDRQQPRYRAEASLVVERGTQPLTGSHGLVETIRDLARSAAVSQSVITNLALRQSTTAFAHDVRITVDGDSAVLQIRVDADSRDRAKAIAEEVGLVVTQAVRQRFGQAAVGGEPVQVAVLDPAHALAEKVSPNRGRDLGWGALFGLIGGLLAANAAASRRPPRLVVEAPPVLGEVGSGEGFDRIAGKLVDLAKERPFQTLVVAGDGDARVSIGIARALGERGEQTAWALAADTEGAALEALAARNAFLLVAAAELDPRLAAHADAVVAVVPASDRIAPLELVLAVRGVRLLGTIVVAAEPEPA